MVISRSFWQSGNCKNVSGSLGWQDINTDIVIIETPCSAHVQPVAHWLFLLSNGKIKFCSLHGYTLFGGKQIDTVAIGLVVAIHEDNHSQTFVDEAFGGYMDREWLWFVGYNNECLNNPVSVACPILCESCASVCPLNGAGQFP